jgi:S1-C subfamily serine protease
MVYLKEEAAKVEIAGFTENSVSEQAGMKAGDIILAMDQTPIRAIDDVKIELLSLKKGDTVKVKVLRKSFFGFNREIDFDVVLQ